MRNIILAAGAATALLGAPALAQTTPAAPTAAAPPAAAPVVNPGQVVRDTQGGRVGTVEAVEGDYAIVATTQTKVRMPKSSFASQNGELVISMTEAQVNAAASPQGTTN